MSRAASFTKAEIARALDAAEEARRKSGDKLAAFVDFFPDRRFRVLLMPADQAAVQAREDGAADDGWEDAA